MANRTGMVLGWAILLIFSGMTSARAQFPAGPRVGNTIDGLDWNTVHTQVSMKLAKTDLIPLFRAAVKAKPTSDLPQLLERLDIFVRMGDRKQADLVIRALAHTDLVQNSEIPGRIADFLMFHNEFDLAGHLMDVCPLATPALPEFFVSHFTRSSSFPNVERWLANREHLNPAYWSPTYLKYRRGMGTLRPLLAERAEEVRAHPQDFARLEAYLAVAHCFPRRPKIARVSDVCHFPLAVENLEAGRQLGDWPDVAIPFLERALQLPITYEDYDWLEIRKGGISADIRQDPRPDDLHRQIKSLLLDSYQSVGESAKAHKLGQEIAAETPRDPSSASGSSEGQPGFGGFGTPMPRTPAPPAEDQNVYTYWLKRAASAIAHKERDQAEQAFQRAIEISRATPGGNEWNRVAVAYAYVAFLTDQKPPMQEVTWLRSELDKTPLEGEYAHSVLGMLLSRIPTGNPDLRPPSETLWRYLAARKQWTDWEKRVLQEMIDTAQAADRDAVWKHAEKLAVGDVDRERTLAYLMDGKGEQERALPLFQHVVQETQNDANQGQYNADLASIALINFNMALTANDWPRTKALWPELRKWLSVVELDGWYRILINAALHAKAYNDAMPFFAAWTRYDYNCYQGPDDARQCVVFVRQLAKDGLREHLRRFYRDLALADPDSHVPQDVLSILTDSPAVNKSGEPGSYPRGGPPPMGGPVSVIRVSAPRPLSLTLTNLDLTTALQRVCDQAEISYVFALQGCTAQRVSLTLKDVTLDQAIKQILTISSPSLPLKYTVQPWFVAVGAPQEPQPPSKATLDPAVERLKWHVTARFRDLSLNLSVDALLGALKIPYDLDIDRQSFSAGPTVSYTGADVPAQDLLHRLMKQSRYPLSYWTERGVFIVGLRDNAPD